jgi:RimJ/RimL family protein N-acetyltransferase
MEEIIFVEFIGLRYIDYSAPFTPAIEVGWRLAHEFWGKGYATEGAFASLRHGFKVLKASEIVSVTFEGNLRSRAVMEKIGMHSDLEDAFDHPNLAEGHPLRRHVLYRIRIEEMCC